jgi:arginine exporter protein ArgO
VQAPLIGTLSVRRLGLPLFTIALGLIDGFNPCAMWALLLILGILVRLRDRRRMVAIAGTFVAVGGAMYFVFLGAWLEFFLLVGFSRGVQLMLGIVALAVGALNLKDAVAFKRGPSLGVPEALKPGIYAHIRRVLAAPTLPLALLAVALLSLAVNLVELLCTAGLPAVYTHVLGTQDLPRAAYYGYLLLYVAAYVLDDSLMLALVTITLTRTRLQERAGRWLKLVSGAVMAALGLLLILKPAWVTALN